jgi:hypothetical protein
MGKLMLDYYPPQTWSRAGAVLACMDALTWWYDSLADHLGPADSQGLCVTLSSLSGAGSFHLSRSPFLHVYPDVCAPRDYQAWLILVPVLQPNHTKGRHATAVSTQLLNNEAGRG